MTFPVTFFPSSVVFWLDMPKSKRGRSRAGSSTAAAPTARRTSLRESTRISSRAVNTVPSTPRSSASSTGQTSALTTDPSAGSLQDLLAIVRSEVQTSFQAQVAALSQASSQPPVSQQTTPQASLQQLTPQFPAVTSGMDVCMCMPGVVSLFGGPLHVGTGPSTD